VQAYAGSHGSSRCPRLHQPYRLCCLGQRRKLLGLLLLLRAWQLHRDFHAQLWLHRLLLKLRLHRLLLL
jgi:hypothetical protein